MLAALQAGCSNDAGDNRSASGGSTNASSNGQGGSSTVGSVTTSGGAGASGGAKAASDASSSGESSKSGGSSSSSQINGGSTATGGSRTGGAMTGTAGAGGGKGGSTSDTRSTGGRTTGESSGSGGRSGDTGGAATGGAAGKSSAGTTTGGASGSTGTTTPTGDMPLVYETENTGSECKVATSFPAFSALPAVANLPDPFLMESGTRISSKSEWACRRNEISAQIQHWELGTKPPPSASEVTATFSGGSLSVDVKVGSKSVKLTSTLSVPSGSGPFPVLIKMDMSSLPADIFSSRNIATMTFTSSQLAAQMPTRGSGTFWNLFPDNTAGAYAGWAWGVSRLIDGLQKTASQNKIDTKRIAVTGCSYAGKMALWAGAFDERIALTMPEESGGGGEASWRFMATQTGTEDLEAAQGTGWYSSNLLQFKNKDAPKLPFDQHSLVAMVAPRAILAIENTGIDRLGSQAGGVSMKAATKVYEALGVPDRIGYTQAQASGHCQFPSSQKADVEAYVDKFLLGKAANTPIAKTSYNTDMTKWITWDTPKLK